MATIREQFETLLQAAGVAARAHEGQRRKDGRTPYVSHPYRVCLVVQVVFGFSDSDMLTAALLHDTIEDTSTDFDDLAEQFGEEPARWVALLSKDKRLPEEEREAAYCRALAGAPWQVKACKLADMFDNLMDIGTVSAGVRPIKLHRLEKYLQTLEMDAAAELKKPLALVRELLHNALESRP